MGHSAKETQATQAEATYRQLTAASVAAEEARQANPCRATSEAQREARYRATDAYWDWQTALQHWETAQRNATG